MFRTFITGVVLGVVAVLAALYFVPVVDQGRERSLVTVQANGGNTESFHVNLPADRIFAGNSAGRPTLPDGAQWPEFMLGKDTRTELFKVRNAEDRVVGVASRIAADTGQQSLIEWAVHLPARGTLYLVLDEQATAAGTRAGGLRAGTREFADLKGSVVESYEEITGETAGGRLELTTALVGPDEDIPRRTGCAAVKYFVALILGLLVGAALGVLAVYMNPFVAKQSVSPLAVSSGETLNLGYTRVPSESVLFTNDGAQSASPFPGDAAELWESTIRHSRVRVVELHSSRGLPVGLGIKFSSDSEATEVLNGRALVDSVWHIVIPGRGSLLVGQQENYWSYLRDVVAKARWSSDDNWGGAWSAVTTAGPNAIGTGRVFGGFGEFANLEAEAVETVTATAYSAERGPVAMDGGLTISLPAAPRP